MSITSKILVVACAGMLVAAHAGAAAPEGTDRPEIEIKRVVLSQNQVWSLIQSSGPELYTDFCASCHGLDAKGNVTVARALGVPPPDLTRLQEVGISSEHVAYVLRSSCDDAHHRAPDGTDTMPCWRRIFRTSLGSDAAAFPVINRLVDYIDSIQVAETALTSGAASPGNE